MKVSVDSMWMCSIKTLQKQVDCPQGIVGNIFTANNSKARPCQVFQGCRDDETITGYGRGTDSCGNRTLLCCI